MKGRPRPPKSHPQGLAMSHYLAHYKSMTGPEKTADEKSNNLYLIRIKIIMIWVI